MADKTDEPPKTVVATKKGLSKRQIWIIVAAVLVAGAVGLGAWIKLHHKSVSDVPQLDNAALITAVGKDLEKKDYAAALKLVQGQKTIKSTETQLVLATVYTNKGDYTAALAVYAALNKKGQLSADSLAAAAALAQQTGDNQTALNYYRAALTKAQADQNLVNNDVVPTYQYHISELEKKGAK
ncbi:MAG TPA: hypothetical protein VJR27_04535 [Candidatus Saccharimonadales bacterium]|nr:hypothetical protein [Candidatus Saccharimonadales bacterium]